MKIKNTAGGHYPSHQPSNEGFRPLGGHGGTAPTENETGLTDKYGHIVTPVHFNKTRPAFNSYQVAVFVAAIHLLRVDKFRDRLLHYNNPTDRYSSGGRRSNRDG